MKALLPLFPVMIWLSSCLSPMSSLQPEIDQFNKQYSSQIAFHQGPHRLLRYAWTGDPSKRPVIFVHGSPGEWEGWVHFLMDPDLQKNFQLISVDRPGYGGSGEGETEVSLSRQGDDIIDVRKINKSGLPAMLVGHSFGGPVIAKIVMDHPQEIAGLVFVASSVSPDLEETKWYQIPANWWGIRSIIPTALRVCNQEILPLKDELTEMLPLWKNITAKSVLIQGEIDDLVPVGNLDFLLSHLNPQTVVQTVRMPATNHFIPWQHPEVIKTGVLELNKALN